jgi:hypothetical protein
MCVQYILFSVVGKFQKHAAEKVTILASFHEITGSLKRRVYELHSSQSGSVMFFGMQLMKLLDYCIK